MAPPSEPPKPTLRSVLQLPGFRKLWVAQFVSIFGDFLALFGVISLITFRWHGNVMQVTTVTIAYMLPLAFVGPLAGVFVDRWNVKRVMIASDLIRAVLALLLVFVTDVAQIAALFVVLSAVSAFFAPAQSVTVRTLVPVEKLLAANALMSQAFYTVRILSPALAGALVAWLSEKACFTLDAVSFLFSAGMILTLTIPRKAPAPGGGRSLGGFFREFTSGNRFIFSHASLAFVISAMAAAMFVLSCFSPLISIYVRDFLSAGSFLFGVVSSMVGVGLIAGTQMVNRLGRSRDRREIVLAGLLGLGFGVALLATFRSFPAAAASTFAMGWAIAFVLVPAQTLMQQETPPAMMGRVSSSFMSVIAVAQILGLLLSGTLAHLLGVRPLFLACALLLALLAGAGYLRRSAAAAAEPSPGT